jgi:hypothetical protein
VDFRQGICNPIAFHRSDLAQFEIEDFCSSQNKVDPDYQLPFEYCSTFDAHRGRRADSLVARLDVTLKSVPSSQDGSQSSYSHGHSPKSSRYSPIRATTAARGSTSTCWRCRRCGRSGRSKSYALASSAVLQRLSLNRMDRFDQCMLEV